MLMIFIYYKYDKTVLFSTIYNVCMQGNSNNGILLYNILYEIFKEFLV